MQAWATHQSSKIKIQNLFTCPEGVEYVGTVEEVKIEIETKVTPRQEPYQNR